ncbi:MAG: tRNA pseudouridine(38-40) synthase TruA [Clostridia bacterium]|nr:tRNA pseudouridine(38-40) synthase TruA [Clostridia bacterium]
MKILLYISFLGTNYCGYQAQKNGNTVQQTLCAAAERVFGFPCDITGCSRTDSGVHANMFCAAVTERGREDINTSIPMSKIPLAFASVLPPDISVTSAREADNAFHPRYDVKYKEYEYKIYNRAVPSPFWADRSWHYPRRIDDGALGRMKDAARHFVGTHDFASYMASGSDVKDTVRTVCRADVCREGDFVIFRVSADGFLYNMVRILTGTLVAVAEGKISPDDIDKITAARDRSLAGITVPAKGLYLNYVDYGDKYPS